MSRARSRFASRGALRAWVVAAATGAALSFAAACEPPPSGATAGGAPEPPIAKVWRSRCGRCHVRVEPDTRSRAHLEAALARHRKRVRLREDQWRDLLEFLAPPAPPPPPPPPPAPAAPVPCIPRPTASSAPPPAPVLGSAAAPKPSSEITDAGLGSD